MQSPLLDILHRLIKRVGILGLNSRLEAVDIQETFGWQIILFIQIGTFHSHQVGKILGTKNTMEAL